MKIAVIQEEIIQEDITEEELTASWEKLEEIPGVSQVGIYTPVPYPSVETISELLDDADALFGVWIDRELIREEFFEQHPKLKYIATLGHGWEDFDVEMTRRHGVTITNTVYGAQTIAEYAFALLIDCCHHIARHDARIHSFDWSDPQNAGEFCRTETRQIELYGKTIGIAGLGAIGFAMAKMARGFGMQVLAYSRRKRSGAEYEFINQTDSIDELLKKSDFVSLHMPHTPETTHMINRERIAEMKDGAILINTARGALIDEAALAEALACGKLQAAGLDVLTEEPPVNGSPLLTAPNCLITGHIAWLTRESRLRAIDMAISNFKAYLAGTPESIIN